MSNLYDMIHPGEGDTSTVRSVFIVDPKNKVRLTLTYPKSVGRNFDEILRVIDALQLTDRAAVSTPVDWTPGDRVIVSPALSTADAIERFGDVEEVTPYLRWTPQPATWAPRADLSFGSGGPTQTARAMSWAEIREDSMQRCRGPNRRDLPRPGRPRAMDR